MGIDKVLIPGDCLLPVLAVIEVVCTIENMNSGMLLMVFTLLVTPEAKALLSGVLPRPLKEDWQPLPNRDTHTGHWEYDFSCIPYSETPKGPAFVR